MWLPCPKPALPGWRSEARALAAKKAIGLKDHFLAWEVQWPPCAHGRACGPSAGKLSCTDVPHQTQLVEGRAGWETVPPYAMGTVLSWDQETVSVLAGYRLPGPALGLGCSPNARLRDCPVPTAPNSDNV